MNIIGKKLPTISVVKVKDHEPYYHFSLLSIMRKLMVICLICSFRVSGVCRKVSGQQENLSESATIFQTFSWMEEIS